MTIRHIEYLILRNDCVVIPGIGALIAHYAPARIDQELGCMFPPTRTLGFNPDLKHNDGTLASSIARGMSTGIDIATAAMSKELSAMKVQLENSGEYPLGRLGVLRLDGETLLFQPWETTAITPQLAGLRGIAITPVARKLKEEMTPARPARSRSLARRVVNMAASVALLACLGITLTTPIVENSANFAGFGTLATVSHVEEPRFTAIEQPAITLNIALPSPEPITEKPAAEEIAAIETAKPEKTRLNPSDRYYLIVASLPTRAKAEEYIASQPSGSELAIVNSEGRFRVYAATGNSGEQARRPLADKDFAARYPGAWVCRN